MYGSHTVRNFMHRTFDPVFQNDEMTDKVFIMWSNLNGQNIDAKKCRPNHFVPLLSTSNDGHIKGIPLVEDSEEEMSPIMECDMDDSSDSIFNTRLLEHIIEGLEHISEEELEHTSEEARHFILSAHFCT